MQLRYACFTRGFYSFHVPQPGVGVLNTQAGAPYRQTLVTYRSFSLPYIHGRLRVHSFWMASLQPSISPAWRWRRQRIKDGTCTGRKTMRLSLDYFSRTPHRDPIQTVNNLSYFLMRSDIRCERRIHLQRVVDDTWDRYDTCDRYDNCDLTAVSSNEVFLDIAITCFCDVFMLFAPQTTRRSSGLFATPI